MTQHSIDGPRWLEVPLGNDRVRVPCFADLPDLEELVTVVTPEEKLLREIFGEKSTPQALPVIMNRTARERLLERLRSRKHAVPPPARPPKIWNGSLVWEREDA